MIHPNYLKPKISIAEIGSIRFWTGIVFGFVITLLLQAVNLYTIAATSVSVGFLFTVFIWVGCQKRKDRIHMLRARSAMCLIIVFLILAFIFKQISVKLSLFLVEEFANFSHNFVRQLPPMTQSVLYEPIPSEPISFSDMIFYRRVLLCIPILIFCYAWSCIQCIFKTGYWLWYIIGICLVLAILLYIHAFFMLGNLISVFHDSRMYPG